MIKKNLFSVLKFFVLLLNSFPGSVWLSLFVLQLLKAQSAFLSIKQYDQVQRVLKYQATSLRINRVIEPSSVASHRSVDFFCSALLLLLVKLTDLIRGCLVSSRYYIFTEKLI